MTRISTQPKAVVAIHVSTCTLFCYSEHRFEAATQGGYLWTKYSTESLNHQAALQQRCTSPWPANSDSILIHVWLDRKPAVDIKLPFWECRNWAKPKQNSLRVLYDLLLVFLTMSLRLCYTSLPTLYFILLVHKITYSIVKLAQKCWLSVAVGEKAQRSYAGVRCVR